MDSFDVTVIGGGPAGIAAAISAAQEGAKVLLIEREARLGGILKQCIHDGFGVIRFGEKLTGPEYAERYINMLKETSAEISLLTFVTKIEEYKKDYKIAFVNREGVKNILTKTIILANGCRERTAKQISIHGTRPAGVYTAGTAQYYTNILGYIPGRKCIILGSGDIGLIMARRLTLEGAKVLGVYEAKSTPSGLSRNIHQCLHDFDIPLYLNHTVARVFGRQRLEAVEISRVDNQMTPIKGTEQRVECDTLILSVGLIPENELAQNLDIPLDRCTGGPICDDSFMTKKDGVFSCGNALHVNDLVDYVSESGHEAGKAAAVYTKVNQEYINVIKDDSLLYIVPQRIRKDNGGKAIFYFRSKNVMSKSLLTISCGSETIHKKTFSQLRPPEMERIEVDLSNARLINSNILTFSLGEVVQS